MKIFLTGFPGSGKTFLGMRCASLLKIPFIDLDRLVEQKTGSSITEIFRNDGEDFFRTLEAECLRSLAVKRSALIATGGGLPCLNDNMSWMNEHGLTIYLEASGAFLFHRLLKEKHSRPLISALSDIELMIYITETLAGRRKWYEQSKLTLNAETCTPSKLAAAIQKISKK